MLARLFGFDKETMNIRKEVVGGITTFLTMAYILAVNPSILSTTGMDAGALFTATCLSAIIATLVMAIYAKLPFALAPGMGLNAFFAFTVCGAMGYPWQFAITAVMLEGITFIILTITGVRARIIESLPQVIRTAISPAIGFFLAFVGLQSTGIIVDNPDTLVSLGNMHDTGVLLSFFGILLCSALIIRNITGALLLGMLTTAIIGIPFGITHINGIVSMPPSIEPVLLKFQWNDIFSIDMMICVFTLLFLDMFDTIGTLIGVTQRANIVDKDGNAKNLNKALMADAVGTLAGACLGTSTVTTFAESAAGVNAGGRSGLTSFTTSICFVMALLFAPFFLSIPSQATAPALFIVGVMMMTELDKINYKQLEDTIPSLICIIIMPLAYSISDGILLGLLSFVILRVCTGKAKEICIGTYLLAVFIVLKYTFL